MVIDFVGVLAAEDPVPVIIFPMILAVNQTLNNSFQPDRQSRDAVANPGSNWLRGLS